MTVAAIGTFRPHTITRKISYYEVIMLDIFSTDRLAKKMQRDMKAEAKRLGMVNQRFSFSRPLPFNFGTWIEYHLDGEIPIGG